MQRIAVIDVGKTNAKLALVDLATMAELAVRTRPNTVRPGPPWPHFDLDGHWAFFSEGLRAFHRDHGIDGISVTTHGAAAALIGRDGRAFPMLDYEHSGPESRFAAYNSIRPAFALTGSPRLPNGLNLGAQLHYMLAADPDMRGSIAHVVTYPQYWGFRLTGEVASDVSSLGCHTDLWLPGERCYSDLPENLGLAECMAPARNPGEVLGLLSAQAAAETGLPKGLPVAVGIHDSNASLLPHLMVRKGPFSVVSTGTWVIMMSMRGEPVTLDPARDTLINVNALGEPVLSARFMGGREFDIVNDGWQGQPSDADREAVLRGQVQLLPSVVQGSGPFPHRAMEWTAPPDGPGVRRVALSYYLALMTETGLRAVGAKGPVIVEGPFARNTDYVAMLGSICAGGVIVSASATGTSAGAALLLAQGQPGRAAEPQTRKDPGLEGYAAAWTRNCR